MQVEPWVLFEPLVNMVVIMGPVIIQDQMQIPSCWGLAINLTEEFQKLHIPMARVATANDGALQDVERREQASGSIAFVVVRHRSTTAFFHRQSRLSSIQRLNLRFLVHA